MRSKVKKKKFFLRRVFFSLFILSFVVSSELLFSSELSMKKVKKIVSVFTFSSSDNLKEGFFIFPVDFKVSKRGEIFFIDSKTGKVLKYSKYGKFEKYIGNKGQGPGEYILPQRLFLSESKLYVYDGMLRKINTYKLKGEYVNTLDIGKDLAMSSDFYVDKDENVFAIWIDYSKNHRLDTVGKIMPKENIFEKIKILKKVKIKSAVMGGVLHEYSPKLFLRVFSGGLVYCNNMERAVYFYDLKKDISRKLFQIEWKREVITPKEIAFFRKTIGKEETKKLPRYKPYYRNIFIDDNGWIYFVKPSHILVPYKNKKLRIVVCNKRGKYLFEFKLPKGSRPLSISDEGIYLLMNKDDEFYISKFVFENK